jgi:hypothetical protein
MRTLCSLFALSLALWAQTDVLTQHNNNLRTGATTGETRLTVTGVTARFGRLWRLPADAQLLAQPLYVSNLKTKGRPEGANAVIFATMNNTVYAYEADRSPSRSNDTLLWARWLGPPQSNYDDDRNVDVFYTTDPGWGIVSTPVIDRAGGTIYVVACLGERGGLLRLHALSLYDGTDRTAPRILEASIGKKRLDPTAQKQRAGLLLDGGVLYLGIGSTREFGPEALNGWLLAYDARTLAPLAAWCSTPGGANGGIWASGQGPAADGLGNIYVATGNGTFDEAARGRRNYGSSVVRLRLEGPPGHRELRVKDSFTPCSQEVLSEQDLDLGSAGPVLFDNKASLVIGGKQGRLYTMGALRLGGYRRPPLPALECADNPDVLSGVQASAGHIYGSPVYWQGARHAWIYVWGAGGRLKAFPVANARLAAEGVKSGDFDLATQQAYFARQAPRDPCVHNALADAWMPGGVASISSNGNRPGTGIVWAMVPANGDANRCRGIKGMLMALDAEDVSRELWRSQRRAPGNSDGPDSLGLLARFVPPTVAGGKVFVATFGDGEPRDFYYRGKRPKTHYPPRPPDRPRWYYVAVYGLK